MRNATLQVLGAGAMVVLALGHVPVASGQARPPARAATAAFDQCLVGTWHDDGGVTSTQWRGTRVPLQFSGGDVDHIYATSVDNDDFSASTPAVGTYKGHMLAQLVRGTDDERFTTSGSGSTRTVKITAEGWSPGSYLRFLYRGKGSRGYLRRVGSDTYRYHCTSTTLKLRTKAGRLLESETRTSRTP